MLLQQIFCWEIAMLLGELDSDSLQTTLHVYVSQLDISFMAVSEGEATV